MPVAKFYGNYFFFPKEINSSDELEKTIKRCNRAYKTQDVFVSRKILKIESDNNVIYDRYKGGFV